MKKYFIVVLFFVFFLASWNNAFAQISLAVLNQAITVDVSERYQGFFEQFFEETLQNNYDAAFGKMTEGFSQTTTLEDFKLLAKGTGLTTFIKKIWTSIEKKLLGFLVVVQGEFITPDYGIHYLTFVLVDQPHDIKIRNISEKLSLQDLKKRFPAKPDLADLIKKDLHAVIPLIMEDEAMGIYNYFSNAAKNRIKLADVYKLLLSFRRQKFDLSFSEGAPIVIFYKVSPKLTKEGLMEVSGNFQNPKYTINFTLSYDYEWRWRLAGFTFDVRLL